MSRTATGASAIVLERGSRGEPLHEQVYEGLRHAIVSGQFAPGARLASARVLAADLVVSRNTMLTALTQLRAEGYVKMRERSGTFVAPSIPDRTLIVTSARKGRNSSTSSAATARLGLSRRGSTLAGLMRGAAAEDSTRGTSAPRAFRTGVPALDEFPWALWARITARRIRAGMQSLGDYGPAAGHPRLRAAIAEHVAAMRGITCDPEQVIITNGAQQTIDIIGRLILDPGDTVWMEDPGYPRARACFLAAGATVIPVPIDGEGLDVLAGERTAPNARLVYVTPSHQYPTGAVMTAARRLALLNWASRADAWIVEDDYDSVYRYASRPLAALHGLDDDGRVLYVGTFSKTLFPALRIGYVIVPNSLVDAFAGMRAIADRHAASVEQAVLAEFLAEGHFASHVRRMRVLYEERRDALLAGAPSILGDRLVLSAAEAGLHAVGHLQTGVDDRAASTRALEHSVVVAPMSRYYATRRPERGALLLGYAAYSPRVIRAALRRLGEALDV